MERQPIGQDWDERTYRGVGPHPADSRAAVSAAQVAALITVARPGTIAEHVGSTAVPGLAGKNIVDLQITAGPADVPAITEDLLGLGFARQRGREPWPAGRPMLEGTFRSRGGVFLLHCHVVATTDPEVGQNRIATQTPDSLQYTHAKGQLIRSLLGG